MEPEDATEGDKGTVDVDVVAVSRTVAQPAPLDSHGLAIQQSVELTKELKSVSNGAERRRDAIMMASRRRHQKALSLEQNEHWKMQYEITATLSSAVKLTDLNRQSVDNSIAMKIVQIGPGIASNLLHAQRKAKNVQSLRDKIEREGLQELLEQGDTRSFQQQQGKRRLAERSLEKQIQMAQTKASLALDCSRRLQVKVRGTSLELSANYRVFNDLTEQLLERQNYIKAAFEPIRTVAQDKRNSRMLLQQLELDAAQDRRELERQHLDLFKIEHKSERKPERPLSGLQPIEQADATSLFLGGLEDANPKKPRSLARPQQLKVVQTLDQELEEVEVNTVQASWGLAIIKTKLQSTQSRLGKIHAAAERIVHATAVENLDSITDCFLNAGECALMLYKQLGDVRDEIATLESELRATQRREIAPLDQQCEEFRLHLMSVAMKDGIMKDELSEGYRNVALICEEVSSLMGDFQLPKPMVQLSDLNLFEALAVVETYVYSLVSGDSRPPMRQTSTIIEEPSAQRLFLSWNTPRHRRARTFLESREFAKAINEELKLVDL